MEDLKPYDKGELGSLPPTKERALEMLSALAAAQADPERRDQVGYSLSINMQAPEAVGLLTDLLGLRVVASLSGTTETRAVREWAEGSRSPRRDSMVRLRLAVRLAGIVYANDKPWLYESWIISPNPWLDQRIPASVLAEWNADEEDYEDKILGLINAAKNLSEA